MFRLSFFLLCVWALCNCCYAERYIKPLRNNDQEEILIQGASVIVSNKINNILMYQTCETIINNKGNFYFSTSNRTGRPINLYFSNLKVTDQFGRSVKVVHKNEILSKKRTEKNWQNFASCLSVGLESMKANEAGKIDYRSQTHNNFNSNFRATSSGEWATGSINGYSTSTTQGTIQCEALRRQALRQVEEDAVYRNNLIQATYDDWEYKISNYYFDSTTVFPDITYMANFQIELPSYIEKDLQYLFFNFEIDHEIHTFCFYCGEEVKKWYHLW